ncbi:MAG: nuclear transport factor 2 family protein [Acidobacteria bacterium]|nr:nuclear transport factor 2 family protein [Acidobacteriota bacterium]MBI3422255.1 nuclear transport factor 2 family protein [Acidobacteriota bacterium]
MVGTRALALFKTALATGEWPPFFELLADDFTLYFPHGKFQGLSVGKAQGEAFFHLVTEAFGGCLTITEVMRVAASETTFIFEFRNEGHLRGAEYKNRVTISWDIRGEQIVAAREYFGSDGKSN